MSAKGSTVRGRFGPVSAQAMAPMAPAFRIAPNPGTGVMNLSLALPKGGDVTIRVYDSSGREVAQKLLSGLKAGLQQEQWDVRDRSGHPLAKGSYHVRMGTPSGERSARWLELK